MIKGMKVALVNPGRDKKWSVAEPLNIGYIASYLDTKGIEVKLIDELAGQNVQKEIDSYSPCIVGITATTPLVNDAYRIAKECRNKGILTVMGGVHATVMPEEVANHCDVVVVGEGEYAMYEIIEKAIKRGVVYGSPLQNIDYIPKPTRYLIDMKFYMRTRDRLGDTVSHLHFVPPGQKLGVILSSRGCSYKCSFCHNSWRPTKPQFHNPKRVIDELKELVNKYGLKYIFFTDDNLLANKRRLVEICNLIKGNNLQMTWCCNATGNDIQKDMIRIIKEAGCKQIMFGIESGSQRILDLLNKRTKVDRNAQALRLCKEAGFIVTASFIIGSPTETIEDIKLTQNFIKFNAEYLDMIGVNIMTPYPGTAIWEWCKKQGLIQQSLSWNDFNQENNPPIQVCEAISPSQLEKLRLQTLMMKQPELSRLWAKIRSNPVKTVSQSIRHPSIIKTFLQGYFSIKAQS